MGKGKRNTSDTINARLNLVMKSGKFVLGYLGWDGSTGFWRVKKPKFQPPQSPFKDKL